MSQRPERERRVHERVEVEERVQHHELKFPLVQIRSGVSPIHDVSGGGILFSSERPYDIGATLQLDLRLPGWETWLESSVQFAALRGKPLTAVGEVVRCEPRSSGGHAIGVKFANIYPQHREALFNYLRSYKPLQEKAEEIKKRLAGEG